MKHFSFLPRWVKTARQLRLALIGLTLLFVTLIFSTLDLTVQLNHYTIASSKDSLLNTSQSSVSMLETYLERQMSYVQRVATAIATLPPGSETEIRKLLDEYFQRSDFAQMWAVTLDKQALSAQGSTLDLSGELVLDSAFQGESGYSPVYTSRIYNEDRFYVYVPVRISPEQPVTGAVLGVLSCDQLLESLQLYGLSEESCLAVFQADGTLVYACDNLKQQMGSSDNFWDTISGQNLSGLPQENDVIFGSNNSVAYLCIPTGIQDWYFYQDVPQSALLATNTQEIHLMLVMALKMLIASVIMLVLLAIYHHQRENQVQQAEDSLRTTNQMLEMALQHTAISLFVYDLITHNIIPCMESSTSQLSSVPADPTMLVQKGVVAPQHSTEFLNLFRRICRDHSTVQGDFLLRRSGQQEYHWNRITLTTVRTKGEDPTRAIVTLEDIADERRREDELRQRAYRDSLTGLYNRQGLRVHMREMMKDPPAKAAMLMMDLDHFKAVNDTLGHPMGDVLLLHVAKLLEQLAPDPSMRVRLGGDEFLILTPDMDWQQAEELAAQICKQLPSLADDLDLSMPVGTSVGIHVFDPMAESLVQAYQKADVALYAAKKDRGHWMSTRNLPNL